MSGNRPTERTVKAADTQLFFVFLHFGKSSNLFEYPENLQDSLARLRRLDGVTESPSHTLSDGAENRIQVGWRKALGEDFQELLKDSGVGLGKNLRRLGRQFVDDVWLPRAGASPGWLDEAVAL